MSSKDKQVVEEANIVTIEKPDEIMHQSGEELYRCYLDGDETAFEKLVALYENRLSRFIFSMVGDFHETEHLTIDTFAQLALNKKPFEGKSTLKTYLFGIANNLTAQHLKKRKREQHISFDEIAGLDISDGETTHALLEKSDNKSALMNAMRELKEEYHAVLILLYFEGMSYRQAGKAMNKSERQIKNLAYRAKAALRKKLEETSFSPYA